MMMRRYGFWKYETLTLYTSSAMSKKLQATASAEPHCPTPVSVVSALVPASLFKYDSQLVKGGGIRHIVNHMTDIVMNLKVT